MSPLHPVLSVIVVAYRRTDLLLVCLESLRTACEHVHHPTELLVVVNEANAAKAELIRSSQPDMSLIEIETNVGFAPAVTRGIALARGRWIGLFNDDVVVTPWALHRMLATGTSAPDIGSVAAQMRFANEPRIVNSAGLEVDRLGIAVDRLVGWPVSASEITDVEVFGASGGAGIFRRSMLDHVGGFDESFFAYLEDADLAWRARMAGWRSMYCPHAVVYHHHSATLGHGSPAKAFLVGRNRVRLLAKNATTRHLLRHGLEIFAYDAAYVAYAAAAHRTLAPLTGRWRGLREWRRYRRLGARRPVNLAATGGLKAALRRNRAWGAGSAAGARSFRESSTGPESDRGVPHQ